MPGNALIGNLAVNLTMETAAFQKGATIAEKRANALSGRMSKLSGTFKTFAVGFAGGLVAGMIPAIGSVVSGAFEMASSLSEAAEKVGLTVEALQELRFAAGQTGVSNEQLDAAIIRLTKSMGDLQLGEKEAVDAFKAIGLAAEDLKGKTPDQALRLIADALNKIPDPATRVAIGQDLMGRGFAKLLPLINGGSTALDKFAQESREAGQISTEDAAKLDELADGWDKLKVRVGVATVNIISGIVRTAERLDAGIKRWWAYRDGVIASISAAAKGAVKWVNDMVTGIGNAVTNRLSAIWNGAKAKIDAVTGWFKDMYDAVVGHSYVPDMVEEIGATMLKLDEKMVEPSKKAAESTKQVFAQLRSELSSLLAHLYPDVSENNRIMADIELLERAMKKGLLTANQYSDAMARVASENLTDPEILGGKSSAELGEEMADSILFITEKLPEFGEEATRTTQQVIEGFGAMAVGVIGSVRSMVDTFKSGDVLGGIQQFLGLLLNVIQSLAQIGIIKLPAPAGAPTPRAQGGPVSPGRSYLVGEHGPEVVSFGRRGYVSPNKDNAQTRIQVIPSPYFEVVVDDRASRVAAPMAGQAAVMGAAGAHQASHRQQRRMIP